MDGFQELEFKYSAEEISLSEFKEKMNQIGYVKSVAVSSWDVYYTNSTPDQFCRFRNDGSRPELTKKLKTKDHNNWVRQEVDLPLDPSRIDEKIMAKYMEMEGYQENFRIYKSCFIYWTETLNYVYYIVYDVDLKEKARFIEVEVNKNMVSRAMFERAAWDANSRQVVPLPMEYLKEGEASLSGLGISPQKRLRKSLFEMFRKE